MKRLLDLEIPQASTLIVLHRQDGSTTVSVEPDVAEQAMRAYRRTLGAIAWPPGHLLSEPVLLTDEVT